MLSDKSYVTFEVARRLKAIGFDEPVQTFYSVSSDRSRVWCGVSSSSENHNDADRHYSRPLLQEALFWFLNVHNISLRINHAESLYKRRWFFDCLNLNNGDYCDDDDYHTEYEDAINAGISAMCEYLSNNAKR